MAVKDEVRVTVGVDASTVVFDGARIEISADGQQVTAYTNGGVDAQASKRAAGGKDGVRLHVSKDFRTVLLNGVTIKRAGGNDLVIVAAGAVVVKPEIGRSGILEVGARMEDGTIYAGMSPDTKRRMFVTSEDVAIAVAWPEARLRAAALVAHGRNDWTLPSEKELGVLYVHREKGALKGTFNAAGGWYWSAREASASGDGKVRRFSDGWDGKYLAGLVSAAPTVAAVRAVRFEAGA